MKATRLPYWRQTLAVLAATTALSFSALPTWADNNQGNNQNGNPNAGSPTQTPIKHLVVIFGENISFDHYFATYPHAANGAGEPKFTAADDTPAVNNLHAAGLLTNNPNLRQPFRLTRAEAYTCSQDHNYTDEQKAVDGGLNDKYVQATAHMGVGCRTDGSTVMAYYDGNTVTGLWNYAQHYAMSDNSFDSQFGPSTVGVLNLVAGQTGGAHLALTFSGGQVATFNAVTVTGDPDPALDDCGSDQGGTVLGKNTVEMEGKNIGDLLNAQNISWGWFQGGFAPTSAAVLNADGSTKTPAVCGASHPGHPGVPNPTALDGNPSNTDIHGAVTDYSAHHSGFMYYKSTRNQHHLRPASAAEIGHNGQANHNYDMSDFYTALKAGNLPAVSFLKAPAYQDEHPGNSDPLSAQTFMVDVINALQQSGEWKDTAVVINYDDTDGWYDHVPGPVVNQTAFNTGTNNGSTNANDSYIPTLPLSTSTTPASPGAISTSGVCGTPASTAAAATPRCGYGPRLPYLVVSPWSKVNYVSHKTTDQSSTIAFVEYNWNLPFIDGATAPAAGTASFDRIAGSILNMFDFDDQPNMGRLILNDQTGLVVDDASGDGNSQN
ncbi:MAG TPA: alkaline phosphatase family protein [Stellaceae bacterium]|nr:alkaline phosphatase family protein [Stellaceae bacterium]